MRLRWRQVGNWYESTQMFSYIRHALDTTTRERYPTATLLIGTYTALVT